jgi:hypothetical protein
MLQIILFTLKNLIYSCLLFKLYRFDLFYTEFSFVLSDGQDLSDTPQEHWWTLSSWTACNILEFSPGMLAMQKCGFQNFDLKLSA